MAVNFVADYQTMVIPMMDDAIETFLNTKAYDALVGYIDIAADSVVYSYPASQRAMHTRRYHIGDESSLKKTVAGHTLYIENTMTLQDDPGVLETDIVQRGLRSYRQPYPRPFMDVALEEYTESGQADNDLAEILREYGFDVITT